MCTGLPGYYGVDEEESEMTLGFWYLFQKALWDKDHRDTTEAAVDDQTIFSELVQVLRRKVAFPPAGSGWSRDSFFMLFLLLIAMRQIKLRNFKCTISLRRSLSMVSSGRPGEAHTYVCTKIAYLRGRKSQYSYLFIAYLRLMGGRYQHRIVYRSRRVVAAAGCLRKQTFGVFFMDEVRRRFIAGL